MAATIMDDYSRLTEILSVDVLELDQDYPFGPFTWDGATWRTVRRADLATTTHITLHGRSTDRWYRAMPFGFDRRQPGWRSLDGGSRAPDSVVRALTAACEARS